MHLVAGRSVIYVAAALAQFAATGVEENLPDWEGLNRIPEPERVSWQTLGACNEIQNRELGNSLVCMASFDSTGDGSYSITSAYGQGLIEFRSGITVSEFNGSIDNYAPDERFYSALGIGTDLELYGSGPITICGWTMKWGRLKIDTTGFVFMDRHRNLPTPEWTSYWEPPRVRKPLLIPYPEEVRKAGIAGKVIARIWIGADGIVVGNDVIDSPSPILGNICKEAIESCIFTPARKRDGTPSKSCCVATFEFRMESEYARCLGPCLNPECRIPWHGTG